MVSVGMQTYSSGTKYTLPRRSMEARSVRARKWFIFLQFRVFG
jgi:hypothetical protein